MIYKKFEKALQSSKTEAEWIKKLQKIKDINYIDEEGFCALGVSAYFGSLQACKYILDRGGNPNLKNKYGETPLYIAIENWASKGHHFFNAKAIISLLLEKGADVNAHDKDRKTILMHASQRLKMIWPEHKNLFQKLIDLGADIYAKDIYDINALMYAANNGNYDIVKTLINKGIDVNLKDEDGKNALYYAVDYSYDAGYKDDLVKQKKSREKIIELLLDQKSDINICNKANGDTLLHIASYYGDNKLVKLCINNKLNLNKQDNFGITPLMKAALSGKADIIDMLLFAGANPALKDQKKKTAIWYALKYSYMKEDVQKVCEKYKLV